MSGTVWYPMTREEVALKLMEKIMMAERKSQVFVMGKKVSRREQTLDLYARCIAAVDGRHGREPRG
ncbi:hypothetical protein [Roseomonas xinghualingensis]|uniref:hypothetical protein n=1 Tax=Roseomonas xinghualingensis TaxID=2986475 RepID=UPI0021F20F8E|nr:hypothetical protein [Roseomonas sp. SXEYE001]MCV4208007.1 hypothetical protein [Roseomonas sp. SXEYE001]